MGQPQPSAGQFYLQITERVARALDDLPAREWGAVEDGNSPRLIRGRKYYWHGDSTKTAMQRHVRREHQSATMASQVEIVKEGAEFDATICFENLSETELGGVLAAIHPGLLLNPSPAPWKEEDEAGDQSLGVLGRIGGGKPFGFGAVEVTSIRLSTHTAEERYQSLTSASRELGVLVESYKRSVREDGSGVEETWPALANALTPGYVNPERIWYPPGKNWPPAGVTLGGNDAKRFDESFRFFAATTGERLATLTKEIHPLPDSGNARSDAANRPPAGQGGRLMMTYLDVSASRIQEYLVRYPRLRSITAASSMLASETRWDAIEAVVDGRGRPNPAAGDADGKSSLIVVEAADVEELAQDIVAHLLTRLPAARFEAHWADAESYPDALALMTQRSGAGSGFTTPPPLNTVPVQRLCDRCVVSPATERLEDIDGEAWSCSDCALRVPDIRSGHRVRGETILEGFEVPSDFDELAKLGNDGKRNHLATIYADGNSVGKFFKDALADCDPDQLNQLSEAVTTATRQAVRGAALNIQPDEERTIASIAHVIGGDDVLVTVPASFGWQFARTYLETFSNLMEQALEAVAPDAGLAAPTASAGVIFSHKSFPFATVFSLAAGVLDSAKAGDVTRPSPDGPDGRPAMVSWIDITSDGLDGPSYRHPLSVDYLAESEGEITALAAISASARSNLETYLSGANPFIAAARVRKLQRRLRFPGLEPFVADLPRIPVSVPSEQESLDAHRRIDLLRNMLSLADWWPA